MNNTYYGKLIFELSNPGCIGYSLPENKWNNHSLQSLPSHLMRSMETILPEVDELTVVRHYTNMSNNNFGVDTGFYPLGSCTMKYNPKINEEMASLPGFTQLHPHQSAESSQGALELYYNVQKSLAEIAGMEEFTLNPFAGAHGELTGLMVIRTYHEKRGDHKRTKIIVPDSAHGTNPASAAVCGLQIVEVKSTADGTVDVEDLKPLLGDDIAGMMMTNPNTLGIFETKIPEIARLVHECGGLMYYDGANLNPMLGVCRPGDMGFDVMHINLHKTFSTPHGGGGPGSGPVGVRRGLEEYLPNPQVKLTPQGTFELVMNPDSLGSVSAFLGNFGIIIRAYAYLLSLGKEYVPMAGKLSVLNANYIKECLKEYYQLPIDGLCKHEFVFDGLRDEYGGDHHQPDHVTTLDVAKRLLDYGFHAPTIYFPLLFHEAMMIEPTETESKQTLDEFIAVMKTIATEARDKREILKSAPHQTPVRRLDDVKAVKEPKFTFKML
ncbi:MAG: aminomethyl-transferring glycine dehydrogenase subunit GcvPB [Bacteroides sp.]|nr:aminomethyl-transferring glycine dehydrogenase subunit GcvPB [Bacteroides sp.]MCM1448488.1 aminomethyl-transferring glycine dehydrogenase subunit GcvPB [Bacteroides sp.]